MTIPKRTLRGLQDIHPLAGTVDQAATPYRVYMRLSCLEMEKFRRGKERICAMHRVHSIDARSREIEAEKAQLLEILGERRSGKPSKRPAAEDGAVSDPKEKTFKIRY